MSVKPAVKKAAPSVSTGASGRATINDVARRAGVSKATVSRFLNHRDTLLSAHIADRVEQAVAALEYTPSPMAQALKRGRSRLIGLVVADVTNPYSVAVLRGAEKACQDAGYLVMLFNLGNQPGRELEAIEALASYQVEGFILNTLGHDAGALAAASRRDKPVVLVDRRHSDMQADFVSLDNDGAMCLAARHLVETGCTDLMFVSEPLRDVSSRIERHAAFRAFVGANGRHLHGELFESSADNDAALDAALLGLARRASGGRPAVITGNAFVTLRVAAATARLGWQFGIDLALVGFDDTDWAPLIGPGISTVAQPTDDLGRTAANCLIERLGGMSVPPRQILLPGRLRVRGSSAARA